MTGVTYEDPSARGRLGPVPGPSPSFAQMSSAWSAAVVGGLLSALVSTTATYYIKAGGEFGYRSVPISVGFGAPPGALLTVWALVELAKRRRLGTELYWWGAVATCGGVALVALVLLAFIERGRVLVWTALTFSALAALALAGVTLFRRAREGAHSSYGKTTLGS